jgi:hypothetical protein
MITFYTRGAERRCCETRLAVDGKGYELVIHDSGLTYTERFSDLGALLGREHELVTAWRALGWRTPMPGVRSWPQDDRIDKDKSA